MELENEAWRVQLRTGELRLMSLDALDEAFDAGVVDAQTPVLAPGSTTWDRLGAVAGLDDVAPPQLAVATPSLSPMAFSPSSVAPPSTGYNLDFDLDVPDDALKPKRGRLFAVVGVAALVLVAGAAGLVASLGGSAEAKLSDIKVTSAVQAPPPAVEAPPLAIESAPPTSQLTDEQKKKLSEADKTREGKARAAKEKAAAQQQRRTGRPGTKGTGLLKGGNKFDPLNGSL